MVGMKWNYFLKETELSSNNSKRKGLVKEIKTQMKQNCND
jgi:hypothetical protein